MYGKISMKSAHRTFCAAIFTTLVLFSIILAGCGEKTVHEPNTESVIEQSESTVSEPEGQAQHTHLFKEYSEYFLLDADVVTQIGLNESLYASTVKFDTNELCSMLMQGQNPVRGDSSDNSEAIYYIYEDGNIKEHINIGTYGGSVFYRDLNFSRNIKFPTENFVTQTEYSYLNNGNPPYSLVYKEKELGFMPSAEAVSTVRSLLDSIGVTTMPEVEVFAIDHETMQSYQNFLLESESSSVGFYDIKNPLTKADEFYILRFTAACIGLPVSSFDNDVNDRCVWGSSIEAYYSAQGIVLLNCSGIYSPQGTAERNDALITAEQAADIAFEHYNSFISELSENGYDIAEWLGGMYEVRKAELVYVPTAYNDNRDEVILTPAWQLTVRCRTVEDKYYGSTYDVCDIITINAATGEII